VFAAARRDHRPRGDPPVRRRIVQLGGRAVGQDVGAPADDQHAPVGQERRGVSLAARGELAGGGPATGAGIVAFRRPRRPPALVAGPGAPADDQDRAIPEERRGVAAARGRQRRGRRPGPRRRVVELGRGEHAAPTGAAARIVAPPDEQYPPAREEGRRGIAVLGHPTRRLLGPAIGRRVVDRRHQARLFPRAGRARAEGEDAAVGQGHERADTAAVVGPECGRRRGRDPGADRAGGGWQDERPAEREDTQGQEQGEAGRAHGYDLRVSVQGVGSGYGA